MNIIKIMSFMFFSMLGINSAKAEPISAIIALIGTFAATVGAGVTALGTAIIGATAWTTLVGFLASPIGALILGIGVQLISSLFMQKPGKKNQQVPTIEAGKVNVRVPEPERWLAAGEVRQGGGVLFAEFDSNGQFWYLIVHSDSSLVSTVKYYFDDIELTFDGNGNVFNHDFSLDTSYNAYNGSGQQTPYYQIFTTTFTETNPTPPAIASLKLAFAQWTDDHKLVGTTYSVIRVLNIPAEHRHKIFKWRGPVGVGEPALAVVGRWSRCYDPRDITQTLGTPSTYKFTKNSALIWAWFRTHRYGRNKTNNSINWSKVGEMANICDQNVVGITGTQKRYECAIAIPESKERSEAEQEILLACDGQLVFDDDGKCWPRVGYYYNPVVYLSRNRDILAMESVEAQNGESETQGVIVRYIDPSAKYISQPSAAWINPFWYVEGETPKFLTIDALAITNHNQAMRLAKSIGLRSQAPHKLLPTVALRGLRARQERIINIQYDNNFSGDYEIVTPVEVDSNGLICGMGIVPIDENRFNLIEDEEQSKAVFGVGLYSSITPSLPTGVILSFRNNRIEAVFDTSPRADWRYQFQYLPVTENPVTGLWSNMTVDTLENFAYSGTIDTTKDYYVRWKTLSSSGLSSLYISPILTVQTNILTLTGSAVLTATVSIAYTNFTIGVTGGTTPYMFVDLFNRLPTGITINTSTGVVSGMPTIAGTYSNIRLRVQDNNGAIANFPTFTITVIP